MVISTEHQTVIIAYLAEKLGCEETWYITPSFDFFGKTPLDVVLEGDGDTVIEYLETRLGLIPGAAF